MLHRPNPTDNFIIVLDCSCLFRWFLWVFWVKSTESSLALCNLGLYAPLVCFLERTRALLFEAISLQMVIRAGCNGKSCTANATVHVWLPFSKQSTYPGTVFFHCRKRYKCSLLKVFIPFFFIFLDLQQLQVVLKWVLSHLIQNIWKHNYILRKYTKSWYKSCNLLLYYSRAKGLVKGAVCNIWTNALIYFIIKQFQK